MNTCERLKVFCVLIISRRSFDQMNVFRNQIHLANNVDSIPMVIVGNKCDLELDRQVSRREGQEVAESFACPFFEASVKNNVNVEASFCEDLKRI